MWIPIGSLPNSAASVERLVRFAMASKVPNLGSGLIVTAMACVLIVLANVECKAQKLSDVVVWTNGKAYLFYDTGQYVRYDIASDRADEQYPKHIAGNWPGVWENKIDAVLTWNNGKAYFFKGSQYIRYDIARDRADDGYPADISTFWHGLWDKDIDAAVMWNDGFAYFFKGDEVMQYDIQEKHRPKKLKITDRFKGIWAKDIDAAVLWNSTTAFFFKGDEYILYDVENNRTLESYPRPIIGNWGGLSYNQAAYFGWRGYADTNLRFAAFFDHDHTILARFMPQYVYGYAGPVLAESSNGTYVVGQGRYKASTVPQVVMKVGGKEQSYASPILASGTWVNLAVVRSGNTFKLFINGDLMQPVIVIDPRDKDLPAADNRLRLGRRTDGKKVNDSEAQFYGLIDDVVVFNKALTTSEIVERQNRPGHILKRGDPNVAAWVFDPLRNPPKVVADSKIIFKTLTPNTTPSGLTLVSYPVNNKTDSGLLPLAFQREKRQLPFRLGQAWKVIQGMNDPTGSHNGISAFAIDFILTGDESKNKVPNPNADNRSCGEPVLASATGWVAQINDVGGGGPDKNDFDGPNYLYIEHIRGEEESYFHMFTSFNMNYIQPKDRDKDGRILIKKGEQVGTVGALNGCHLHTGVFTKDNEDSSGVDFPQEYNDYEVSDDEGAHWRRVDRGTPKKDQWVRRPVN